MDRSDLCDPRVASRCQTSDCNSWVTAEESEDGEHANAWNLKAARPATLYRFHH